MKILQKKTYLIDFIILKLEENYSLIAANFHVMFEVVK